MAHEETTIIINYAGHAIDKLTELRSRLQNFIDTDTLTEANLQSLRPLVDEVKAEVRDIDQHLTEAIHEAHGNGE